MDCDRPNAGAVADIMRSIRLQYHYAVRKVKKNEETIVRDRFAQAILNNNQRNFWAEFNRIP